MKALIIWYNVVDENNILGGVEYYLFYLNKILNENNIKIDFLYLDENKIWKIKKNNEDKPIILKRSYIKKRIIKKINIKKNYSSLKKIFIDKFECKLLDNFLKQEIINKNYAYIINNIPLFFSKKIRKNRSVFFVQHTDVSFYKKYFRVNDLKSKKFGYFKFFCFLIINFCLFTDKNCLKKYKNVVFYSNIKEYKTINKCMLVGSVPIDSFLTTQDFNKLIENKKNNSILYFGRFDNESKNLELLADISKMGNFNIDLFGFGNYETELKKNSLFNLKGKIKTGDEKISILSKYDIFILPSNYEGISIATIELLSMGVIGIIRNTFLEAKNLIPIKYQKLLLMDSKANVKEYVDKIDFIRNLKSSEKNKIRIDLIEHVKNNYSLKNFQNNWNKILENIKYTIN